MDEKKLENLEQLADDIRALRGALFRNRDLIKKWLLRRSIRFATFYTGIVIVLFAVLEYYFTSSYGGYDAIPPFIRTIMLIAFIIAMLVPVIVKFLTLFQVKGSFPDTSFPGLIFKFFGVPILSCHLLIIVIVTVLIVFLCINGMIPFIVPVLCIGIGLMFFFFGSQFGFMELSAMGLWQVITGLLSIPFIAHNALAAWLWLGIGLGAGFLIFPTITEIKRLLKKE